MDNCKKAPQTTSRFKVAPRTTKCTNMTLQTTKECKKGSFCQNIPITLLPRVIYSYNK